MEVKLDMTKWKFSFLQALLDEHMQQVVDVLQAKVAALEASIGVKDARLMGLAAENSKLQVRKVQGLTECPTVVAGQLCTEQ